MDERGKNPKSLAALVTTQWKPGQSGNPTGINQDPQVRKIKKLTTEEVVEVGSLLLSKNIVALQHMVEDALVNPDSEHSSLKVWIARVVLQGGKKGDARALESVLNRLIGKVADKMIVDGINAPQVIVEMPSNGREVNGDGTNQIEATGGTSTEILSDSR